MVLTVFLNKKGVSLIEVMIALLIFLIINIAVMQTSLISIESNLKNELRDEAVRIASDRMEEARNIAFDNLVSDPVPGDNFEIKACKKTPVSDTSNYSLKITRNIRNNSFNFGSRRTVTDFGMDTKQISILVRWEYKGDCYSHSITSVRKRV